jgi:hypothetical protein
VTVKGLRVVDRQAGKMTTLRTVKGESNLCSDLLESDAKTEGGQCAALRGQAVPDRSPGIIRGCPSAHGIGYTGHDILLEGEEMPLPDKKHRGG